MICLRTELNGDPKRAYSEAKPNRPNANNDISNRTECKQKMTAPLLLDTEWGIFQVAF